MCVCAINQRTLIGDNARAGLRVLAIGIGIFFLAMAANKLEWIEHPELLTHRLEQWLPAAAPYAKWYLRTIAIPGAPVFARVVPIAELSIGFALLTGALINVAAGAALVMVLNFHFATSAFSSTEFLRDGTGPPLLAGLLALAMAGTNLPFAIKLSRR